MALGWNSYLCEVGISTVHMKSNTHFIIYVYCVFFEGTGYWLCCLNGSGGRVGHGPSEERKQCGIRRDPIQAPGLPWSPRGPREGKSWSQSLGCLDSGERRAIGVWGGWASCHQNPWNTEGPGLCFSATLACGHGLGFAQPQTRKGPGASLLPLASSLHCPAP